MSSSPSGNDVAASTPMPTPNPPGSVPARAARSRWRGKSAFVLCGLVVVGVGVYALGVNLWASKQFAAAERALERRDFAEAKDRLARCQSVREQTPEDLLLAVRIARRSQANAKAETLIRLFRQNFPDNPDIERESRLLRTQLGSFPDIDAALTEALARGDGADPWELEAALIGAGVVSLAAFNRGEVLPGSWVSPLLRDMRRGADLWLRLRPAAPDQVEGLVWRGLSRALGSDQDGALADFRAALALDPEHRDARVHLARSLQQERPAEATKHFELLHQRDPADVGFTYNLATVYRRTGRIEEAVVLLDAALAAEPNNLLFLIDRGTLALDQGQLARAERWLTRAQQLAPHDPTVNFALANCLRAVGRLDEAKTFQERAQRLQSQHQPQKPTDHPALSAPDEPSRTP